MIHQAARLRFSAQIGVLAFLLHVLPVRQGRAEDRLDVKTIYYEEGDGRVSVFAPTFLYEKSFGPSLTIKVEGIYNSISGATPSGAPPVARSGDDGREDEREDIGEGPSFVYRAGATPSSAPSTPTSSGRGSGTSSSTSSSSPAAADALGGTLPFGDIEDTRMGLNVEVIKRLDRHALSGKLSFSTEDDYDSFGLALGDAIDFNMRNTTLRFGVGVTHDIVSPVNVSTDEDKDTVELLVGVDQLLGPKTRVSANVTYGRVEGFMTDPYKVVELNGALVPENRPGEQDKTTVALSFARFIEALRASAEVSYRWYDDSFGITSHTTSLAWYQRVGSEFIVRPVVRLYDQSAADFYAVRFSGTPAFYSADYRVSEMQALGYGMKLIWSPSTRLSFDVAYERYEQEGKDSQTSADAYPSADIVTTGVRLWF